MGLTIFRKMFIIFVQSHKRNLGFLFYIFLGSIWRCWNSHLFEQKEVNVRAAIKKVSAYFAEIGRVKKHTKKRQIVYKDIWKDLPAGFLDGAYKQRDCRCGAHLVIEPGRFYHFCGREAEAQTVGPKLLLCGGFCHILDGSGDSTYLWRCKKHNKLG